MKAMLSYRGGSIKQEKAEALVGKLSGMRNSLLRVCMCVSVCKLNHVRLFVTPWTVDCRAPLSMISR